MTTVTIPQEIIGEKELVAVPRRRYEVFLAWEEKTHKTFAPSPTIKQALVRGRRNFREGNYLTLKQLKNGLAGRD